MSIDLSQFFDVFFEESFEGLDVMEAELLNLQPGTEDSETINTIFRAAHSIKGGSGTFGFTSVTNFTHVLETLLDQIRDGRRQLTAEHVNLLLQSVDCLRGFLSALQEEEETDLTESSELKAQFDRILGMKSKLSRVNHSQARLRPKQTLTKSTSNPTHIYLKRAMSRSICLVSLRS